MSLMGERHKCVLPSFCIYEDLFESHTLCRGLFGKTKIRKVEQSQDLFCKEGHFG